MVGVMEATASPLTGQGADVVDAIDAIDEMEAIEYEVPGAIESI